MESEKRESATLHLGEDDKEFDERIQVQLETVNQAIRDINAQSNSFQRAKEHFHDVLEAARARLKRAYKRYPYGIEQGRPYFELREKCLEAKIVLRDLSARHRDACLDLEDAKEAEVLAGQTLAAVMADTGGQGGGISDPAVLAKLNHANDRVIMAHNYKEALGEEKEKYTEYVDSLDLRLVNKCRELRSYLETAWPYFHLKAELKNTLDRLFFDLRQRHIELQHTKEIHKAAFEHMDQLSSEIAQRQKVSKDHQTLMQLSKFEEMEDMENFDLDCTEDSVDPLAESSASMWAMCSFDSHDAEQGSSLSPSDIQYGAQAYPENDEQPNDSSTASMQVANGVSIAMATSSLNSSENVSDNQVLTDEVPSDPSSASADATIASTDDVVISYMSETTDQTQTETNDHNDPLVDKPIAIAGIAVGSAAVIDAATDSNTKSSPKYSSSISKDGKQTQSTADVQAEAVSPVLVSSVCVKDNVTAKDPKPTNAGAQLTHASPPVTTTNSKTKTNTPTSTHITSSQSNDVSSTKNTVSPVKEIPSTTTTSLQPKNTTSIATSQTKDVNATKDLTSSTTASSQPKGLSSNTSSNSQSKDTHPAYPNSSQSKSTSAKDRTMAQSKDTIPQKTESYKSKDTTPTTTISSQSNEVSHKHIAKSQSKDVSSTLTNSRSKDISSTDSTHPRLNDSTRTKTSSKAKETTTTMSNQPKENSPTPNPSSNSTDDNKLPQSNTRSQQKDKTTANNSKSSDKQRNVSANTMAKQDTKKKAQAKETKPVVKGTEPAKQKANQPDKPVEKPDPKKAKIASVNSAANDKQSQNITHMNDVNKTRKSSTAEHIIESSKTASKTHTDTNTAMPGKLKQTNGAANKTETDVGSNSENMRIVKETDTSNSALDKSRKEQSQKSNVMQASSLAGTAKAVHTVSDSEAKTFDRTKTEIASVEAQRVSHNTKLNETSVTTSTINKTESSVVSYDNTPGKVTNSADQTNLSKATPTAQKEVQQEYSAKRTTGNGTKYTTIKDIEKKSISKTDAQKPLQNDSGKKNETSKATNKTDNVEVGIDTKAMTHKQPATEAMPNKQRKKSPTPPPNVSKVQKESAKGEQIDVTLKANATKTKAIKSSGDMKSKSIQESMTHTSQSLTTDASSIPYEQPSVKPKTNKGTTKSNSQNNVEINPTTLKSYQKTISESVSKKTTANKVDKEVKVETSKKRTAPLPPPIKRTLPQTPKTNEKPTQPSTTSPVPESMAKPGSYTGTMEKADSSEAVVPSSGQSTVEQVNSKSSSGNAPIDKQSAKKKSAQLEVVQTKTEVIAEATKPKHSSTKRQKSQTKDNDTNVSKLQHNSTQAKAQTGVAESTFQNLQHEPDYEELNAVSQIKGVLVNTENSNTRRHFRKAPPPPPSQHVSNEHNLQTYTPEGHDKLAHQDTLDFQQNVSDTAPDHVRAQRPTSGHFRMAPPPPPSRQKKSTKRVQFNTELNQTTCFTNDFEDPVYENIDEVLQSIRRSTETDSIDSMNEFGPFEEYQHHSNMPDSKNSESQTLKIETYMDEMDVPLYENLPLSKSEVIPNETCDPNPFISNIDIDDSQLTKSPVSAKKSIEVATIINAHNNGANNDRVKDDKHSDKTDKVGGEQATGEDFTVKSAYGVMGINETHSGSQPDASKTNKEDVNKAPKQDDSHKNTSEEGNEKASWEDNDETVTSEVNAQGAITTQPSDKQLVGKHVDMTVANNNARHISGDPMAASDVRKDQIGGAQISGNIAGVANLVNDGSGGTGESGFTQVNSVNGIKEGNVTNDNINVTSRENTDLTNDIEKTDIAPEGYSESITGRDAVKVIEGDNNTVMEAFDDVLEQYSSLLQDSHTDNLTAGTSDKSDTTRIPEDRDAQEVPQSKDSSVREFTQQNVKTYSEGKSVNARAHTMDTEGFSLVSETATDSVQTITDSASKTSQEGISKDGISDHATKSRDSTVQQNTCDDTFSSQTVNVPAEGANIVNKKQETPDTDTQAIKLLEEAESDDRHVKQDEEDSILPVQNLVKYFEKKKSQPVEPDISDTPIISFKVNL